MKNDSLLKVVLLILIISLNPLQAQQTGLQPATVTADDAPEPDAAPEKAVREPPPLEMSTTKIYSGGVLHATLAKVNTGSEFIGLTVPARYWFQASKNGREIVVYTDSARRDSIVFRFHTNRFSNFSHEEVWPMVSSYFDDAHPTFARGSAMGQAALVFSARSGSDLNPRQTRCIVVPCEAGSVSVTTVVHGAETEKVYHVMKQLAASLQDAASEKELTGSVPTPTD